MQFFKRKKKKPKEEELKNQQLKDINCFVVLW